MREITDARHPVEGSGTDRASTAPLSSLTSRTNINTPAAIGESVQTRESGAYTSTWKQSNLRRGRPYARHQRSPTRTNCRDVRHQGFRPMAVRSAILEGTCVKLASPLIPHFNLGEYRRYAGVEGFKHLLRPLSSDPRLNRNVTLPEFVCALINTVTLCVMYGTAVRS